MAEGIAALAPEALRVIDSGAAPAGLVLQLKAGCNTILSCVRLAGELQGLSAAAAFKISTVCSLAFAPGKAVLEQLLTGSQPGSTAVLMMLLRFCTHQLQAVGAAVCGMLAEQPKAAGAFANSIAKPATLLPWLRTVSRVLTFAASATDANNGK